MALSDDQLAAIKAQTDRAVTELGDVCAEGPSRRFKMTIPADPTRDTDLIISRALEGAEQLLAEVEELRAQRAELVKLHEYDELIFGGFYCTYCTPDDCDDPDDNVYWPCPSLRAAGVTDDEAIEIITARRAAIEKAHRASAAQGAAKTAGGDRG
jgi:hypothetical protein